jgi:hypothetical protein
MIVPQPRREHHAVVRLGKNNVADQEETCEQKDQPFGFGGSPGEKLEHREQNETKGNPLRDADGQRHEENRQKR